jgi:hypothetical protein
MTQTEKGSPWQNREEVEIRELKCKVMRLMERTQAYPQLWDFRMAYTVEL